MPLEVRSAVPSSMFAARFNEADSNLDLITRPSSSHPSQNRDRGQLLSLSSSELPENERRRATFILLTTTTTTSDIHFVDDDNDDDDYNK
ncbi:hypothetical protein VTJ04DRAFT_10539 [Mycothermus thermophilus]|uniref:uncharacterized protein n=1 Tax=Humicola insolens TaxID=85995 RepID=UPI0037429401